MHPVHSTIPTPLGGYALRASARGLTLVAPAPRGAAPQPPDDPVARARLAAAAGALRAFFAGDVHALDALALDPGGSAFERRVWRALREIPPGATASYGEIARRIGRPGAARAVGGACRRNPLALVVPCHRVVAADGGLGGYAGGAERKRRLLALEAQAASKSPRRASASAQPRRRASAFASI